ncbi:Holliday junction branch migration protein RuvA [Thermincola ferriacetica]
MMISFLRGELNYIGEDYIIIDVHGVGYKVYVPASFIGKLPACGQPVTVFTHLYVREDVMQLYGFPDREELELFEVLLQVSGIGPKVAVSVLSAIPASSFKQAIVNEQVGVLMQVPGIGKKTAQRMILELKDKLGKLPGRGQAPPVSANFAPNTEEAVQALIALGYAPNEARKAVNKVVNTHPELGVEESIKKALLELARF